jgi:hypothetical protein
LVSTSENSTQTLPLSFMRHEPDDDSGALPERKVFWNTVPSLRKSNLIERSPPSRTAVNGPFKTNSRAWSWPRTVRSCACADTAATISTSMAAVAWTRRRARGYTPPIRANVSFMSTSAPMSKDGSFLPGPSPRIPCREDDWQPPSSTS